MEAKDTCTHSNLFPCLYFCKQQNLTLWICVQVKKKTKQHNETGMLGVRTKLTKNENRRELWEYLFTTKIVFIFQGNGYMDS